MSNGEPTHEEVAAVLLALDQAAMADARARRRPLLPAWLLAARREALGGAPVTTPSDLRL